MTAENIADTSCRTPTSTGRRARLVWLAVGLLALAGLALRVAAARGDLWLDEAWSYFLLQPLTSIDQIFWAINHDNNHFLNSVWLYLVGPDGPAMAARALSISLGTMTILAAAFAMRGNPAAMVVSAMLFAASTIMVHYGSEARGYSGLVLFTLAAVLLVERRLEGSARPLALAAVVSLGFLSHLTFAATVAVLVLWAAIDIWRRTRSPRLANVEVGSIFGASFLAVIPLALCMLVGRALYGFNVGGVTPFSFERFVTGLGGAIRHSVGAPAWISELPLIAATFVAVLISSIVWPTRRSTLYVIGIVGLPLLMALARLPNVQYPRYFLVSATLLLLWLAELLGRAVVNGGLQRILAAGACIAFLAGNAAVIDGLLRYGRGTYQPIVDRIALDPDSGYGASHAMRIPIVVDLLARSHEHKPRFVPGEEFCAVRPRWFILDGAPTPLSTIEPSPACGVAYDLVEAYPRWKLSGSAWALYRRAAP